MLTKIKKNVGVSEFRKDISKYLKQAKDEPVVIFWISTWHYSKRKVLKVKI